jgi:hypothetical protein
MDIIVTTLLLIGVIFILALPFILIQAHLRFKKRLEKARLRDLQREYLERELGHK